jgi:guanine deaminase
MVWPTESELARVAESGALVVHNPISNVYLGSGFAPVPRMVALNIPLALGSDSACCNHSHNIFETMKWAGMLHNLASPDPTHWLSPAVALDMAIEGGAQALGLAQRGGQISPGRMADLIMIDADSPGLVPLNDPLQQLVYGAERATITRVMVGGEIIYDGQPLNFEVGPLYQETRALAAARLSRFENKIRDAAVPQTIAAAYRRHIFLG